MSVNSAEIKAAPKNSRIADNYLFAFDYACYRYARQNRHFLKTYRSWRFKKLAVSNKRIAPSATGYDRHQG